MSYYWRRHTCRLVEFQKDVKDLIVMAMITSIKTQTRKALPFHKKRRDSKKSICFILQLNKVHSYTIICCDSSLFSWISLSSWKSLTIQITTFSTCSLSWVSKIVSFEFPNLSRNVDNYKISSQSSYSTFIRLSCLSSVNLSWDKSMEFKTNKKLKNTTPYQFQYIPNWRMIFCKRRKKNNTVLIIQMLSMNQSIHY